MVKKLFITISPPHRDSTKKFKNPNRILYLEDKIQIEAVLKYNKIKGYLIYPELDVKGRLHYHGTLRLNHTEEIRFYKHAIHKLKSLGFVDISSPKDWPSELRWCVYQSKEWGKTKQILEIKEPIYLRKTKISAKSRLAIELHNELDNGIIACFRQLERQQDRVE